MMNIFFLTVVVFLQVVSNIQCMSSPVRQFATYRNATELMKNVADLWWTVNEADKEITFELHVKTTGWIALGIVLAGGASEEADMAMGWIDENEQLHFEDRHAPGFLLPIKDSTTQDWFGLQGREENNWTAIQFKRALDTKDTLDIPIESGINILLFAYGLVDPNPDITYHEERRVTYMLPLWKP